MEPFQYPLLYLYGTLGWQISHLDKNGKSFLSITTPLIVQSSLFISRASLAGRDICESSSSVLNAMGIGQLNELLDAQRNAPAGKQVREDITHNETVQGEGGAKLGKIYLPRSFIGGPRYMKIHYENVMALVTRLGSPTATWEENKRACPHGIGRNDPKAQPAECSRSNSSSFCGLSVNVVIDFNKLRDLVWTNFLTNPENLVQLTSNNSDNRYMKETRYRATPQSPCKPTATKIIHTPAGPTTHIYQYVLRVTIRTRQTYQIKPRSRQDHTMACLNVVPSLSTKRREVGPAKYEKLTEKMPSQHNRQLKEQKTSCQQVKNNFRTTNTSGQSEPTQIPQPGKYFRFDADWASFAKATYHSTNERFKKECSYVPSSKPMEGKLSILGARFNEIYWAEVLPARSSVFVAETVSGQRTVFFPTSCGKTAGYGRQVYASLEPESLRQCDEHEELDGLPQAEPVRWKQRPPGSAETLPKLYPGKTWRPTQAASPSLVSKGGSEETLAMTEPKQEQPTLGIPDQETPEHDAAPEQEQKAMVETPKLEQATGLESRPGELQLTRALMVGTQLLLEMMLTQHGGEDDGEEIFTPQRYTRRSKLAVLLHTATTESIPCYSRGGAGTDQTRRRWRWIRRAGGGISGSRPRKRRCRKIHKFPAPPQEEENPLLDAPQRSVSLPASARIGADDRSTPRRSRQRITPNLRHDPAINKVGDAAGDGTPAAQRNGNSSRDLGWRGARRLIREGKCVTLTPPGYPLAGRSFQGCVPPSPGITLCKTG
ncbi:hypothetical protein J6590_084253 [Homalodisca vitripennis]|nr:hypothetical protein J6590_084253 [Homalodisca vitripennis]